MIATELVKMGKRSGTGRPPKGTGDHGTDQVRVRKELAYMLGWIQRLQGVSAAEFLDKHIRGPITNRFTQIEAEVKRIEALEAEARQAEAAAAAKFRDKK